MLYRYFNLTFGLEALQTQRWKVGRMSELNDPLDCRPNMINSATGMAITPEFQRNYLNAVYGFYGLLCFSDTVIDPVIWSHYADGHRGLALGFDFSDLGKLAPQPVMYSTTCRPLDFGTIGTHREDQDPDDAKAKLMIAGFMTKHPSWQYEREHRHVVDLDKCEMQGAHYFCHMPTGHLRDVVLGVNCSVTMQDIERIIKRVSLVPNKVRISRCKAQQASLDLELETLPRSPQKA